MIDLERIIDETTKAYDVLSRRYRRRPWDIIFKIIHDEGGPLTIGDMGCGAGQNAIALCLHTHTVRVVCIDLSWGMVAEALRRARRTGIHYRIVFIQGDIRYPPIKSGCIDSAIYIASLHNIPSRNMRLHALREALRILRRGGKLLVTVWARMQPRFIKHIMINALKKMLGLHKLESIYDIILPFTIAGVRYHRFYHLYSMRELVNDVKEAGFNIIEHGVYNIITKHGFRVPTKNYYVLAKRA